eukprot:1355586-Amorphochlora_amoeboformis.AAC.1
MTSFHYGGTRRAIYRGRSSECESRGSVVSMRESGLGSGEETFSKHQSHDVKFMGRPKTREAYIHMSSSTPRLPRESRAALKVNRIMGCVPSRGDFYSDVAKNIYQDYKESKTILSFMKHINRSGLYHSPSSTKTIFRFSGISPNGRDGLSVGSRSPGLSRASLATPGSDNQSKAHLHPCANVSNVSTMFLKSRLDLISSQSSVVGKSKRPSVQTSLNDLSVSETQSVDMDRSPRNQATSQNGGRPRIGKEPDSPVFREQRALNKTLTHLNKSETSVEAGIEVVSVLVHISEPT